MVADSTPKVTPAVDATSQAGSAAHGDAQANVPDDSAADAAPTETNKAATEGHHAASPAVRHGSRSIDLASSSYRVKPGANFAEIRIRRTSASDASSFEWWTEESTALSGVDYVPQSPAKITFQPGSRTAVVFVKLLADSARRDSAKFNVVVGDVSKGTWWDCRARRSCWRRAPRVLEFRLVNGSYAAQARRGPLSEPRRRLPVVTKRGALSGYPQEAVLQPVASVVHPATLPSMLFTDGRVP